MSEDISAKPDLTKKVRFQTGEKEDRNVDEPVDIDDVRIYDNYWAEGSTPPNSQDVTTEDQQQTTSVSVSSKKRNPLRAAAVFLGLLCLLLVAAVSVLAVLLIQDKSNWNMERYRLQEDNANLQSNYSKMESLIQHLKQKTSQLENEKDLLNATNNNLTEERNELLKQIERALCPVDWIKFGDSCYLLSTTSKTWEESRTFCEDHDAHLVIISSTEEQKMISSFAGKIWIGLTDRDNEGTWTWVDGTEAFTVYWKEPQPDDSGEEDCAMIPWHGNNNKENKNCNETVNEQLCNWNDSPCDSKYNLICEKPNN